MKHLPTLLSVIAGMVDLTGFYALGNIFTAHITGNLVVAAANAVRGGSLDTAGTYAIPVFICALAGLWLIAKSSRKCGIELARLLLAMQLLLLFTVLALTVATSAERDPHGREAEVAAMLAVCAMSCQYAVFRLAIPQTVSTTVMSGNLTTAVLSVVDGLAPAQSLMSGDGARLKSAVVLLGGFLLGCVIAALALPTLHDWTWSLPVVLAAAAFALSAENGH